MKLRDGEESKERSEMQEEGGEEDTRREGRIIISEEEIEKAIRKVKKKKAAGEENLKNEAWIYADGKTKEKLREVLQKICDEKKIPMGWREGWIFPIHKKGDSAKAENYRDITLMDTGYKILTMIIEEKLKKETERLRILPETQAGFKGERSAIDNIYILKTEAERTINEKKGKLFAFLADLRAAFDKVNRQKLWKKMREYGIEEKLIELIVEIIYEETSCRIKIGKKCTRKFRIKKGLRQGCPFSPLLFLILLADVESFFKKRTNGGINIGKRRIYTLAYADNLAVLSTEEGEIKKMLKSLEKYFDEKEMCLNVEKSKILVFSRRDTKKNVRLWKWKREEINIEEVNEFKYLGYTFMKNNPDDAHIRTITKKATAIMAQVWGIGERKFGGDWERKMMMFNVLVNSIVMYGVEIWGWEERKPVEALQERYIRWITELQKCTPEYIVREEIKVDLISIEAGFRVLKYQEKIKKRTGNEILKECRREMEKREWENTRWGKELEKMLAEGGTSRWEREALKVKGQDSIGIWKNNFKQRKEEERRKMIEESKSAGDYKK